MRRVLISGPVKSTRTECPKPHPWAASSSNVSGVASERRRAMRRPGRGPVPYVGAGSRGAFPPAFSGASAWRDRWERGSWSGSSAACPAASSAGRATCGEAVFGGLRRLPVVAVRKAVSSTTSDPKTCSYCFMRPKRLASLARVCAAGRRGAASGPSPGARRRPSRRGSRARRRRIRNVPPAASGRPPRQSAHPPHWRWTGDCGCTGRRERKRHRAGWNAQERGDAAPSPRSVDRRQAENDAFRRTGTECAPYGGLAGELGTRHRRSAGARARSRRRVRTSAVHEVGRGVDEPPDAAPNGGLGERLGHRDIGPPSGPRRPGRRFRARGFERRQMDHRVEAFRPTRPVVDLRRSSGAPSRPRETAVTSSPRSVRWRRGAGR